LPEEFSLSREDVGIVKVVGVFEPPSKASARKSEESILVEFWLTSLVNEKPLISEPAIVKLDEEASGGVGE
jgi:hypothetical protein